MRPRTISLVGAAIVAAGLILQQLVTTSAATALWSSSGTQLDQSMLGALYAVADLVARIAVPLGAAVTGGGIVLLLAARPTTGPEPSGARGDVADGDEARSVRPHPGAGS